MRKIIATKKAPAAVGPYSQAVLAEAAGLLYTAGQIPLDPVSGELVSGSIEIETRQVLKNLQAVLEAGGSSLANVVKITVFLTDMGNFGAMNGVYLEFFPENPPARSAVAVKELPKGVMVEIEAVAIATPQ
ncbi:RidA family protein [bacterium]|nr:RidA family protein [bacterium]